jgi:hypothetical protein
LNLSVKAHRRWAVAGGVLMVVASLGRLSLLALVMCALLRWVMSWSVLRQAISIFGAGAVVSAGLLVAPNPAALLSTMSTAFDSARAGASEVRNEVYQRSWVGFAQAPWLGWGWPGEALVEGERVYEAESGMVVGSHSTVSGLLYKGGVLTFGLMVAALLRTIAGFWRQRGAGRRNCVALLFALILTGLGEGIESLVLPMLFAFVWLGIGLLHTDQRQSLNADRRRPRVT